MNLSVVIPAHNEAGSIDEVVRGVVQTLEREGIDHEVVVVDDASTDGTVAVVVADPRARTRGSAATDRATGRLRPHGSRRS